MKLIKKINHNIVFSDLHISHNNIYDKYEKESRDKINKVLIINWYYNYWKIFITKFFDKYLKRALYLNKDIKYIINLWDFVFNLTTDKINKEKIIIPTIKTFLWNIKEQNISMINILWNHDFQAKVIRKLKFDLQKEKIDYTNIPEKYIKNNQDAINFWKDILKFRPFYIEYIKNTTYIYTHYPLYNSDYYHYTWNIFKDINNYLCAKYKNKKVVNIHWHIHSKQIEDKYKLDNIKYVNACIDNLVKKR